MPTMVESGYRDFEVTGWFGLFASAKTPPAAVDRIYGAAKTVLASPDIKARFADLGGTAGGEPPGTIQEVRAGGEAEVGGSRRRREDSAGISSSRTT